MKTQHLPALDPRVVRAPTEVGVALVRLLDEGALTASVCACIGDLEEAVAKRNLDLFHVPTIVLRRARPTCGGDSYLAALYSYHERHPFAALTTDIRSATPRLAVIEAALALPDRQGVRALLTLKRNAQPVPSSLELAVDVGGAPAAGLQRRVGTQQPGGGRQRLGNPTP